MLVHHLLEESAQKFPCKTALVCDAERWTYGELENCANGLAALHMDAGIVPQDRVIIFLENSVEAVLSIWGVLKAGGVFVVLNPLLKAKNSISFSGTRAPPC